MSVNNLVQNFEKQSISQESKLSQSKQKLSNTNSSTVPRKLPQPQPQVGDHEYVDYQIPIPTQNPILPPPQLPPFQLPPPISYPQNLDPPPLKPLPTQPTSQLPSSQPPNQPLPLPPIQLTTKNHSKGKSSRSHSSSPRDRISPRISPRGHHHQQQGAVQQIQVVPEEGFFDKLGKSMSELFSGAPKERKLEIGSPVEVDIYLNHFDNFLTFSREALNT